MDQQPLTYQQLLAEQYEENAKQILAFTQTEYDQPEEDASEYIVDTYASERGMRGQAIEDPHVFREFAGNRNLEEDIIHPKSFDDKSKLSVRYNKDVKVNVFNIDSKFRAYYLSLAIPDYLPPNPNAGINLAAKSLSPASSSISHFVVRFSKQVKNAISIKLTSFEMPNKFFNISASRGNNSFVVKRLSDNLIRTITVSDSYYTNTTIVSAINTAITSSGILSGSNTLVFNYDSASNKIEVNADGNTGYEIDFSNQEADTELYSTLGQMLGFKTYDYENGGATKIPIVYPITSSGVLIAEFEPDLNIDTYIYLKVNDYNIVIPQTLNDTYYTVFAKIPIVVEKGQTVFDTATQNTTTKLHHFLQPTNIQHLEIQLLDGFGNELQFDPNINFSMTLEVEEVLNQSLYEKMREL